MPITQDEFEEIQYQELRNKVSAERVYAKLNVDYYGAKIGQLNQRLRRSNVLMFLAAASVAVTPLLAVPFGTIAVISVIVLTLVAPVTVILLRHYWSTDFLAYTRARIVAQFIEIGLDGLWQQLDLRDY